MRTEQKQAAPRARWFAVGNVATGFVAIGNVVTGVFAFGNVARGVVAVGNLAVGVVAIGNVGFGVIAGGGATIGIGLVAVAGVLAVPVLDGWAPLQTLTDQTALLGLLPIFVWGIAALIGRGRLPKVDLPALTPLPAIATGEVESGRVLATIRGLSGNRVRVDVDGTAAELETLPEAMDALSMRPRGRWILGVDREERLADDAQGYRDAPTEQHVLRCLSAEPAPFVPLWAESSGIQWLLGRAWAIGAVAGTLAWVAMRLLG